MKKRLLPFIFFTLFAGFSFLLFTASYAGNPVGKSKEAAQLKKESNSGSLLNLNWNDLGPNNAAGRTRTVLFDSKDASGQTMYTGGVAGGIWKSTNLGLTWHQVNTAGNVVLKVSCMTQTPSGTIYVGTGEMSCYKGSFIGSGIYRSDDGETFTQVQGTQPLSGQTSSDWAYVLDLASDQNGRIYAATSSGLKYSNDGSSWATALPGTAIDVEVASDNTVLAAINNEVYIAANGDVNNFVNISTGGNLLPTPAGIGYVKLAIAPSDANIMYAAFATIQGGLSNLFASFDHGASWSIVFPGGASLNPLGTVGCKAMALAVWPEDPHRIIFGGFNLWEGKKESAGYYNWTPVSYGYKYYQQIPGTTDPLPDPLFIPSNHHEYVFSHAVVNQFAVATDDGISVGNWNSSGFAFRHAVKGLEIAQYASVAPSAYSKDAVFGGAEYLGITLIPGDLSTIDAKTAIQIYPKSPGDVAWSVINPYAVFYTIDSAAYPLERSEDLGLTAALSFNDSIQISYFKRPIALWESFNFTASKDTVVYKVIDTIPANSTVLIPSNTGKFPIHYTSPVEVLPGDSITLVDPIAARMFVAGTAISTGAPCIFMTKDAVSFSVNPRWYHIMNITSTDTVSAFGISKDGSTVWAGTTKGKLFRMTNVDEAYNYATADVRGLNYKIHTSTFDQIDGITGKKISSIAVADNNENVLVGIEAYGTSANIFLTTNGLDSIPDFASVQGDMPAMPVYSALFEMSDQSKVLVGTDYGVYGTNNILSGSVNWASENAGLGNVPVTEIVQQKNEGIYYQRPLNYGNIYVATLGRGIFMDSTFTKVLAVDELPVKAAAKAEVKVWPNPFRDNVNISYNVSKSSTVTVSVIDISGRTLRTIELGTQTAGEHQAQISMSGISSGNYLIRVSTGAGEAYGKALKVR